MAKYRLKRIRISLNYQQTNQLANFFTTMAVAWFVAGLTAPNNRALTVAITYGIFCLTTALLLLRKAKKWT